MAGYRTAQGRTVDMATLVAKNEKVRAVGNMNVNARGDILDNQNNVINDNTNRVKNAYNKTVAQAKTKPASTAPQTITPDEPVELSKAEQELFDNDEDFPK